MSEDTSSVAAIRRFNRFYTRWVGALGADLHQSGFSLTEARVLYELAQCDSCLASTLARDLDLDPAYLSRILKRFEGAGWLERERDGIDRRAWALRLTTAGRSMFDPLEAASRRQAATILAALKPAQQDDLVVALSAAQRLLSGTASAAPVIRAHKPGDIGWVISAHGRLYSEAYGWDDTLEALVAEIAAGFLRNLKPSRERCFIAELDGVPVGSSFVVQESETIAKLRLVLVERRAQGLGLGKALVNEAIAFARGAGYRGMTLWTNDILHAARAIYVDAGFELVAEERHHSFGQDLVGQTWELHF